MTLKEKLDILIHHVETLKDSVERLGASSTVTIEIDIKSNMFEKEVDTISDYMDTYICNGVNDVTDFENLRHVYMITKGFSIFIKEEK